MQPLPADGAAEGLRRSVDEFAALYEASRELSAQTNFAALLRTVVDRASSLLGSTSTTVFRYDMATQQMEVVATSGRALRIGTRFALDEGMAGRVAQTGQPLLIEDYQAWEHRIPEVAVGGVRAILMVPMACGGELIGALGVSETAATRTYTEDDLRLLSLFAAHAAGSLRTVQLLEEERRQSILLLLDNAERRRIEDDLRRREERYRSLVEDMNDVVFTLGLDGIITYMSPALERLTGHGPDELVGCSFAKFVHPDDVSELRKGFARVLGGQRDAVEFRVFARDGATRWVRSSSRHHRENGVSVGITGSLTDVTERKRAEIALRESEARYRQLIELSPDGIGVHCNGEIVYINSAGVRLIGAKDVGELLGHSVFDFVHPDDRAGVLGRVQRMLAAGRPVENVDWRMVRLDGQVRDVEAAGMPLLYEGVGAIQVVVRDITERRRAASALAESEERFRMLADASYEGIFVHDHSRIVDVNQAGLTMTGYTYEQLLNMDGLNLLVPESRELAAEKIRTGSTERYDAIVMKADGTRFQAELMGRPVPYHGRECRVTAMRDISVHKRAAAEIRALNDELEQRVLERTAELEAANAELEAFGYSVSHDLRGPLRVIEGFSRLLMDEYGRLLDDDARRYIERVQASSRRMAQLIQDLLNLSRITRNAIQRRRIDLSALARAVAADLSQSQPERVVEFSIAPRAIATGDPSMLRILVENLLGNAWKYTSKHPSARIEFGVRQQHGETVYFVRDDGAGFDMEYVGKLFQPFQRLHLVSEFDGTGIGLATVERIVRRHGGRVWAEGAVEGGAMFFFTLAAGKAEPS